MPWAGVCCQGRQHSVREGAKAQLCSNIIGGQEEATLAKETEKEGSRCRRKQESDAAKAKGGVGFNRV